MPLQHQSQQLFLFLTKLTNDTLVNATQLVDEVTGGGRLSAGSTKWEVSSRQQARHAHMSNTQDTIENNIGRHLHAEKGVPTRSRRDR